MSFILSAIMAGGPGGGRQRVDGPADCQIERSVTGRLMPGTIQR